MIKHIKFNILYIASLAIFLLACSDNEEVDNYGTANWLETGRITMEFSYQDSNVKRSFTLYNNDMIAHTVQLRSYTQKELEDYNQLFGKSYSLMPEEAYKLNATTVSFNNGEQTKEIEVYIYPDKLFNVIKNDTEDKQYVVTLKANDTSIKENKDIVCTIEMSYPVIRLEEGKKIRLMNKDEEEFTINAETYESNNQITLNKGNIDLDIKVIDNAEEWLQNYNKEYDTDYKLLPEGTYELGKMTGGKNEKQATAPVKVTRLFASGKTLEFGNYILPLQLTGKDEFAAIEHNVNVITVTNANGWNDTKREYDDGKNIVFHVKIAIDKEGLEMMDNNLDFFKENLAVQWDEINRRFNKLDKKGILKRNYIYVPDLEDIIVYSKDKGLSWDVAYNYQDRIDREKFQLVVTYDFCKQEGEGGGGYGGKQADEGVNHIMVTCYSTNKDEIRKYAGTEWLSDESIVHELGHFRGLIDTYWCELSASDNLITHQGFQPERGNMMSACYEPLENIEWSEYEMYVINTTGCKNVDLNDKVAEYFPDYVEITVKENGQPAEGFTLNFYPKDNTGSKIEKVSQSYTQSGSKITLNAKYPLFWPSEDGYTHRNWIYNRLLLAEAISQKTGKKGYIFIPVYEVHKQGLKDKAEQPITGNSIFRATINIE